MIFLCSPPCIDRNQIESTWEELEVLRSFKEYADSDVSRIKAENDVAEQEAHRRLRLSLSLTLTLTLSLSLIGGS